MTEPKSKTKSRSSPSTLEIRTRPSPNASETEVTARPRRSERLPKINTSSVRNNVASPKSKSFTKCASVSEHSYTRLCDGVNAFQVLHYTTKLTKPPNEFLAMRMVSYKRLDPEQVRFSGGAFSDERPPVYEETTAVPEAEEEVPLMRWTPRCSVTRSLLVIGCLLLYWLLTSSTAHLPPAPAPAPDRRPKATSSPLGQACALVPEAWRFDCYPERGPSAGQNGVPWCFYPPDFPSYSLVSVQPTPLGQKATLERRQKTYYPGDIMSLQLEVFEETDTRLHVKITDPSSPRYEVPITVPSATEKAQSPHYVLELSKEPFGVIVRRRSTGTVLLNTTVAPLFYADQFLQVSSSLPSAYVYGLGEHRSSFQHDVQWNTLTMWARDVPPTVTHLHITLLHSPCGQRRASYGNSLHITLLHSPCGPETCLLREKPILRCAPVLPGSGEAGLAHGFFLLNSNAMDVVLQPAPAITWRTIGGVLDFYVFLGPEPASVVQQYQEVVGRPAMPIYWALGYHLCRWGYQSSNSTWDVVRSLRNFGIPQTTWERFLDFTYDPVHFDTLPDMVKDLHANNQRYVLILDPGISSTQPPGEYWPYDEGLKRGVFIRDADGNTLIGKVWPGLTAYPDFSDEVTQQWWLENLQRFYRSVPFDGLWIDMNEPSNFLDGSTNGCPDNQMENPPYTPGVLGGLLRSKTVCASAQQKLSSHYNLHSLYGLQEASATYSALIQLLGKRPFVISRSSFPGQGQYSGHWLGDNRSTWRDMAASIAAPGPLCLQPSARDAMRSALLLRYSLFPLLYTLFHRAHAHGHTVARPLMFEFPHDPQTYGIDSQFLWGRGLLVTPVLLPGVDSVAGYFPAGRCSDVSTGRHVVSAGQNRSLSAPLDKINLHLREGSIIPTQVRVRTLTHTGRYHPHAGQDAHTQQVSSHAGQDAHTRGRYHPHAGQDAHTHGRCHPHTGQDALTHGRYHPHAGRDAHTRQVSSPHRSGRSHAAGIIPTQVRTLTHAAGIIPTQVRTLTHAAGIIPHAGQDAQHTAGIIPTQVGTLTRRPNLTLWVSSGQPLHLVCALSADGSASGELFWDDGESLHTYEEQQ
ncbi:hypothetical protein WMY93_005995 [Mugilogobius chulae]|uniref:P-type domain-containing protein n=1 Tax=Mugilogobius chulae TaxID=88201 RepID=A0AAW0PIV2_9GOBI